MVSKGENVGTGLPVEGLELCIGDGQNWEPDEYFAIGNYNWICLYYMMLSPAEKHTNCWVTYRRRNVYVPFSRAVEIVAVSCKQAQSRFLLVLFLFATFRTKNNIKCVHLLLCRPVFIEE